MWKNLYNWLKPDLNASSRLACWPLSDQFLLEYGLFSDGIEDIVTCIAHRGRQNYLTGLLNYPHAQMFAKVRPFDIIWDADVRIKRLIGFKVNALWFFYTTRKALLGRRYNYLPLTHFLYIISLLEIKPCLALVKLWGYKGGRTQTHDPILVWNQVT